MSLTLLPILITLLMVFLTHQTWLALLCGVIAAALIIAGGHPLLAGKLILLKIWHTSGLKLLFDPQTFWQSEKMFLLAFLVVLAILVAVIQESGIAKVYANALATRLKNGRLAQFYAILLSSLLFVDDYLSVLVAGRVNPVLTDRFNVPRLRMAFLTVAFSAPMSTLVPLSTWGAAITALLASAGVGMQVGSLVKQDPFVLLLASAPATMFSIFIIVAAISAIWLKSSRFMISEEQKGLAVKSAFMVEESLWGPLTLFLIPINILFVGTFSVLLYLGGWSVLGGSSTLLESLQRGAPGVALFWAGCASLLATTLIYWVTSNLSVAKFFECVKLGVLDIKNLLVMLLMAWALAGFLVEDLLAGEYLAKLILPYLPLGHLPVALFLVTALITFGIGSAWTAMTIVFPTAIPMLVEISLQNKFNLAHSNLLNLSVGAIISGAVLGNLIAPSADLNIMVAKNTGVDSSQYISGQLRYCLPIAFITALIFTLASGFLIGSPYWQMLAICWGLGISLVMVFIKKVAI